MKKATVIIIILTTCCLAAFRFETGYSSFYVDQIGHFQRQELAFYQQINTGTIRSPQSIDSFRRVIHEHRNEFKKIDFWLRYLEPIVQKHVNGPLPVEWETEVFEKFEKPYRRTGGGLALAEQYLDEPDMSLDSLQKLIRMSVTAMDTYLADSITIQLKKPGHLFLPTGYFF
jgi:cytochrome c peroxidase